MINNPHQTYANTQAKTASPAELTLMLYNGAIRFVKQAVSAMEQKNIEQISNNLQKAQDILRELMSTLNMDYPISHELMPLYDFMHRQLVEANMKKDNVQMMLDVVDLLKDLRGTWMEVIKQTRGHHIAEISAG